MDNNNFNTISLIKKTISMIYIVDKKYLPLSLLFSFLMAVVPVVSIITMQSIINLLQQNYKNLSLLINYVLIYAVVDSISSIVSFSSSYYKTKFSLSFNLFLNQKILTKSSSLKMEDFENSEIYDLIKQSEYAANGGLLAFYENNIEVFRVFITTISYTFILIMFKSWILILALLTPFFKFILSNKINLEQFNLIKKRTCEARKTWYYKFLITNGTSFKELSIYNLFEFFIKKYKVNMSIFNRQDLRIARKRFKYFMLLELFEQLINALVLIYIIFQGFLGVILIGDVLTYMTIIGNTKSNLQKFLSVISEIKKDNLFINQFFQFIELKKSENQNHEKICIDRINKIEIKNLSFKYGDFPSFILKNINLEIDVGDIVVILGKNGSGKTTLAKILLGFYDNYEGEILINGINFKNINLNSYRKCIAALFQDFTRFEASYRENISYGNFSIMNDDKKLLYISEKFKVFDQNSSKKEISLDTMLGYWFENGKQISIGEWQKIALCRAFAKDADLYILDEPNSALDMISEKKLSDLYEELLKSKTGIIIAHKFNNLIKNADKIVVMDNGIILQMGKHDDLLLEKGLYHELYSLHGYDFEPES